MGRCQVCGRSGFLLNTTRCRVCGKDACDRCTVYLFSIFDVRGHPLDRWNACSSQCMEALARKFEEVTSPKAVPIFESQAIDKIPFLMQQFMVCPQNRQWLGEYVATMMRGQPFLVGFAPVRVGSSWFQSSLLPRLEKSVRLIVVQHLITAGRLEDAAKLYEKLGLYKEAGQVRARTGEIRIRKTEVSVDLNSLLAQLKEGGIVVVYRCPNCGGKVKVGKDTKIESLRYCEHCGSKIETMDLADFLRTALS